ncbi:MAG: hypothetical protein SFT93_01260 [Rickettsiaceae bacterium]|nr:hypothetical protein [Rickettsiaceae bacterium]
MINENNNNKLSNEKVINARPCNQEPQDALAKTLPNDPANSTILHTISEMGSSSKEEKPIGDITREDRAQGDLKCHVAGSMTKLKSAIKNTIEKSVEYVKERSKVTFAKYVEYITPKEIYDHSEDEGEAPILQSKEESGSASKYSLEFTGEYTANY